MSEPQDELRIVRTCKILPWPGNPRKVFPEAAIADLAASIKQQGLLQPLLVRPTLSKVAKNKTEQAVAEALGIAGATNYELADGERRWRAAQAAGLVAVPCIVRELTDTDMLEISLVSEGQRADLSPAERADGYARLVEYFDGKVEAAAAKLGKSAATVRAALRLKQLPQEARQALDEGRISLSVAELVAARPSEDMRKNVAAAALQPVDRWGHPDKKGELPSFRDLKEWIRRDCMVELKQAPFSQKEEGLTGAPSCQACPKRTGNDRDTYPDGREDLCTDPACYRQKVQAWQDRKKEEALAQGRKVLVGEEAKKLFPYGGDLSCTAPYYDFKDQCWEDRKGKTQRSYKQLLEAHLKPEQVVTAIDQDGQVHQLVPKDVAVPILQKEHGIKKHVAGNTSSTSYNAERKKAEARQKRAKAAALKALGQAAQAVEKTAGKLAGWTPAVRDLLRVLVCAMAEFAWNDACQRVKQRRGLERSEGPETAVKKLAQELQTAPELLGLLAEILAARQSLNWTSTYSRDPDASVKAWWKLLGVDLGKAFQEVDEELRAREAKKTLKLPAAKGKHKSVLGKEGRTARRTGKKLLAAGGAK